MATTIAEKLEQIKSDFTYVTTFYGDAIDFTGSGSEAEHLERLLGSPTKKTAFDCYRDRLHDIYEKGYEVSDRESKHLPFFEDDRLQIIGERYLLPIPELED